MMESVFAQYEEQGFPIKFAGRLHVRNIAGGVPTDPTIAERWIRSRLYDRGEGRDMLVQEAVAEAMAARGVDPTASNGAALAEAEREAVADVANQSLTGFKRDDVGLYIEGRQLKAGIKEAVSVAADVGKLELRGYGSNPRKQVKSFVAEHVFVVEDKLYLRDLNGDPITEPSDVHQGFVHTYKGDALSYTEVVDEALIDFTAETDKQFTDKQWAALWQTGEREGIGAMRSQGYGKYAVVRWDAI